MPVRFTSLFGLARAVPFALFFAGCSVSQPGATDAGLAKAREQASQGASSFAQRCAHCHGERGEGKAYTPPSMGPGALPVYPRDSSLGPTTTDPVQLQMQSQTRLPGAPSRKPLQTAQDLYDYLSRHTPEPSLRSLTPPELWTLVTFVLIAHGSQVPPGGVTPENASRITI
jgi:Cytochrome c